MLLENSEKAISEYLRRKQIEDTTRSGTARFSPYLFVNTTPPKFHEDRSCEYLSRDYINFYIPPEIEGRGAAEIERFRGFAADNKGLLLENREGVFIQRLKNAFHLKSDISKLSLSNSGVSGFKYFDHPDEVSKKIDQVLHSIEEMGRSEEGSKALKDFMYLSYHKIHLVPKNKTLVLELLNKKRDLVNLIISFYLTEKSQKGFSLDRGFLEAIGFMPCSACGKTRY